MYVFSSPAETLLANVVRDNPPLAITPESVAVDIGCVQEALEPLLKVAGNHIDKCDLQVFFTRLSHIKAPIISTPARTMGDETVIMSFPSSESPSPLSVIASKVRWIALRESFKQSGAPVVEVPSQDDDPYLLLWMRDPCFIVDQYAFFPDPKMIECYKPRDIKKLEDRKKSLEVAKIKMQWLGLTVIEVEGCFFEGGNLVHDPVEDFLLCGNDQLVKQENITPLCKAIERQTGKIWQPAYILTDSWVYPHLDLGQSRVLPDGRFVVAHNLGPELNGEGYKELERLLGKGRLTPANETQPRMMAPNLEIQGDVAFMTGCTDETRRALEDSGVTVNAPRQKDLEGTCFTLAGDFCAVRQIGQGGVHCFTNVAPTRHIKVPEPVIS